MTDPRVEEIRADLRTLIFISDGTKGSDKVARLLNAIPGLLTKLDAAEQRAAQNERYRAEAYALLLTAHADANAAEERERTLIAGVRQVLAIADEYPPTASSNPTSEDGLRRAARYAVAARFRHALSRLLPSTPTEEGKTDE